MCSAWSLAPGSAQLVFTVIVTTSGHIALGRTGSNTTVPRCHDAAVLLWPVLHHAYDHLIQADLSVGLLLVCAPP